MGLIALYTLNATLRITDIATLTGIASGLDGVNVIEGRSILFFSTRDCQGNLLSDVTVEVGEDPDARAVYINTNDAPDVSLTKTGSAGSGVVINIPQGFISVSAFYRGEKIFQQSLRFELDTITSAAIVPSPY